MSLPLFKFTPFGGLSQIGSNISLVESKGSKILIDCGILFPYEDFFDINYLIPNLDSLPDDIETIIFTHGHEDHIGAIYHLIKRFPNIKIWAPRFAAELMWSKLAYYDENAKINIFDEDTIIREGCLTIHPIHVNHSIPQTYGLLIQDEYKSFSTFYVSDFKVDPKTPYEKPFNFEKLKTLSDGSKYKILMADSTNIVSSREKTLSESSLIQPLEKIIADHHGRIFLTAFASNIHRVQTVIDIAHRQKRKVVLYGRSTQMYCDIAIKNNLLNPPHNVFKNADSITGKEQNIIVIVSGCQGDFKSTVRRISSNNDKVFQLHEDDLFIFSSKAIPGNEKKLAMIYNEITEQGCGVITTADAQIHASGHAGREDLKTVYNSFQPDLIIPIHGESHFLNEHALFAEQNGFKSTVMYNYDSFILNDELKYKIEDHIPDLPILIHGNHLEIERDKISARRKLACNGLIILSLNKNSIGKRNLVYEYEFVGLPNIVNEYRKEYDRLITSCIQKNRKTNRLGEELRIATRKYWNSILSYKPQTFVHLV